MKELFDKLSNDSTILITKNYSTSFSIAVRLIAPKIRQAIYNIYGFVRIADEIVDSFEGYPKEELLNRFEQEYRYAYQVGISTNPVINAFQKTVKEYNIEDKLIKAFLKSMRTDLTKKKYLNQKEIKDYIYGSADVVGLMCLKVFVNGSTVEFNQLKESAMRLGSAFQKINFLRDFKQDYEELNRTYFLNITTGNIRLEDKNKIILEIKEDFKVAFKGIKKLPKEAKLGVYIAYRYYIKLMQKIDKLPVSVLKNSRVRVSNFSKIYLLFKSYLRFQLNII